MIFFCEIRFSEEVYAGCLGFTRLSFAHILAEDEESAKERIKRHYESGKASFGDPVKVKNVTVSPALEQNQMKHINLIDRTETPDWLKKLEA